jgi:hypothetical protein
MGRFVQELSRESKQKNGKRNDNWQFFSKSTSKFILRQIPILTSAFEACWLFQQLHQFAMQYMSKSNNELAGCNSWKVICL